ncbi:MAG TPA: hypothetical protein VGH36_02845 [Acetobacteraceae bacterium]|jgi:two-component system chemotaxis sensor kinase CheA
MTYSDSDVAWVVAGMGDPAIAYRSFGSVSPAPLVPQDAAAAGAVLPAPDGSAAAMSSLLGAALPEAAEIGVGAAAPPVPEVPQLAASRHEPVQITVAPLPPPIPTAPPIPAAPPAAPTSTSPFAARVAALAPLAAGTRLSLGDIFRVFSDRSSGAAAPGNPFPFRRR